MPRARRRHRARGGHGVDAERHPAGARLYEAGEHPAGQARLPYSFPGLGGVEAVKGGTPYGAGTIADGGGSRQPSPVELDGARFQGRHVAGIAAKLA